MASSSSLNQMSTNANGDSNFQCATGEFCKLLSANFSHSSHKCFFCQCMVHGICGILHDPSVLRIKIIVIIVMPNII
jgi:hypothetical protein